MTPKYWIGGGILAALIALTLFLWPWNKLKDTLALPYISHQQPVLDPHLPAPDPLSDKLDEALYDGLFNISANPSGIVYEDGLGELIGVTTDNQVIIRLKPSKKWQSSFKTLVDDDEVTVSEGTPVPVTEKDIRFTLRRILSLGSLSPDFILVSQALETFDFTGPDENNEIRFQLKPTRIWTENDVKEVFSFKILPASSNLNQPAYTDGTGPYLLASSTGSPERYVKNPAGDASVTNLILKPFIDNSTYQTEFANGEFNFLPGTPFGAVSPVLSDPESYFARANISTTFFGIMFNTSRLNLAQRKALDGLLNRKEILNRFFKIGTPQQRNILDYTGRENNFSDFLNYSVFPSSSYYVEEEIITPDKTQPAADLSVLPDSIRIKVNLNYGNREELAELVQILNDPALSKGKIRVSTATEAEIAAGNYDALLMGFNGYRSNFLFDLYDIFLREPDLKTYRINLVTNGMGGEINPKSFSKDRNFFRLDAENGQENQEEVNQLLTYLYGFMSSHNIGDKQEYARRIHDLERQLALGSWLFSLPSLNYFSAQFDQSTIYLYGVSSQLSTVEKWKEKKND